MNRPTVLGARRCAFALNTFHSLLYFTPDMSQKLKPYGVTDEADIYLVERAAPLGNVDAAVIAAAFNTFALRVFAGRVPALWDQIPPPLAIALRLEAADRFLRRLLPAELLSSAELARAAAQATHAAQSGTIPGRALYAANTSLAIPHEPHLALWHAATLLREHRGDGHTAVLANFDLTGPDALVLDCASPLGMNSSIVRAKRGWTDDEWSAASGRLISRGLLTADDRLTADGHSLRDTIETETTRLDLAPYQLLGPETTTELGELAFACVDATRSAFPPPLDGFFAPTRSHWQSLT